MVLTFMVGIGGEWWAGRERQCDTKRRSIASSIRR